MHRTDGTTKVLIDRVHGCGDTVGYFMMLLLDIKCVRFGREN